ncbi:hypothetical protein S83_062512, partial [Arachis hypogaea]
QRLLRYAASALLFTEKGVDPFLVSWNRGLNQEYILAFLDIYSIILPHGPPRTRKTSLCKALAQKLSIRFNSRLQNFLKDSRNGKEESNLVFVLIDEVESLAAAKKAAISGSDPSDSIR